MTGEERTAMTDEKDMTARAPRWMRVTLFASLALNLLIVGAVVGVLLGGGPRSSPKGDVRMRDLGLGPYMRALERDDIAALRRGAEQQREQFRKSRTEMRAAFQETLAILRAEELDAPRLAELIQNQSGVAERGRALGMKLLLARIQQMSVVERRGLAQRLEESLKRGRKSGHKNYR